MLLFSYSIISSFLTGMSSLLGPSGFGIELYQFGFAIWSVIIIMMIIIIRLRQHAGGYGVTARRMNERSKRKVGMWSMSFYPRRMKGIEGGV